MFKYVSIHLTSPICSCETQSLAWGINRENKGKAGLFLQCKLCKTQLVIPHKKFVARFKLDSPYPEAGIEEESKDKFTVLDGGKVIDFPNSEEEEVEEEDGDEDVS